MTRSSEGVQSVRGGILPYGSMPTSVGGKGFRASICRSSPEKGRRTGEPEIPGQEMDGWRQETRSLGERSVLRHQMQSGLTVPRRP